MSKFVLLMTSSKNSGGHSSKTSKHHGGMLLLMAVPIIVITGFMVFWLKENYSKEKRNLELRSNVIFKETVRRLQAKKLNLDKVFDDSTGKLRIEVMDNEGPMGIGHPELTDVLNDVTIRLDDSLRGKIEKRPNIFITKESISKDSLLHLAP